MAAKRTFEIAFVGLKQGVHEFNYVVDDKFFVEKGEPDFTNCTANYCWTKRAALCCLNLKLVEKQI